MIGKIIFILCLILLVTFIFASPQLYATDTDTNHRCLLADMSIDEQVQWLTCYEQCLHDSCCIAVSPTGCTKSVIALQGYDFNKRLSSRCDNIHTCKNQSHCAESGLCKQTAGFTGGTFFTMIDDYFLKFTPIQNITVSTGEEGLISGLKVKFQDSVESDHSTSGGTEHEPCSLSSSEYVTSLTVYQGLLWGTYDVIGGIQFTTNEGKQCGPYGKSDGTPTVLNGKKLLYFEGRRGQVYDQVVAVFEC